MAEKVAEMPNFSLRRMVWPHLQQSSSRHAQSYDELYYSPKHGTHPSLQDQNFRRL